MGYSFKASAAEWTCLGPMPRFCEHEAATQVCGVIQREKELLAMCCADCYVIRLYNLETGDVSTPFNNPRYYPGPMCRGDEGEMYVVHRVTGFPILQLNCSTVPFEIKKTIQSGMESLHSICYIPGYKLIVVSTTSAPKKIRAVSVESEEVKWEVKGEVEGKQCNPHGTIFSSPDDALFVADGGNTRILVLNPWDGSLRQVLPLDQKMGATWELCLHNRHLVVHHVSDRKQKISYFSLKTEG